MDLQQLIHDCASSAKDKGFAPSFPEFIALAHSELSEALEEHRKFHADTHVYTSHGEKPEGIPIELADCVIRICHYCGDHHIDLVAAIQQKLAYNRTRPHLHGKKL